MSDLWVQGDERHQVETSVAPLMTRVECLSSWPLPYLPMKLRAQSKMAFWEDQGYVSASSLLEAPNKLSNVWIRDVVTVGLCRQSSWKDSATQNAQIVQIRTTQPVHTNFLFFFLYYFSS